MADHLLVTLEPGASLSQQLYSENGWEMAGHLVVTQGARLHNHC